MFNRQLTRFFCQQTSRTIPRIYEATYDILNTSEYMQTLHAVENHVKIYNSKMAYLSNDKDANAFHNHLEVLNDCEEYEQAYLLSKKWLKKQRTFFFFGKNPMWAEIQAEHKYSKNRLFTGYVKHNTYFFAAVIFSLMALLSLSLFFRQKFAHFLIELNKSFPIPMLVEDEGGTINIEADKEKSNQVMFSDVIGIDEFKDELIELVDFLKNPEKYTSMGAYIPKGILLSGQPGVGQTMLAKAVANESGCSFFYASGSQFDQIFVGSGAKNIRALFEKAKKKQPAIIFIDEIDSIGGKRGSNMTDTLNQLLTEMDGFQKNSRIIVIGATNMPDILDQALMRPGRFDQKIHIPLPDVDGRTQLFEAYMKQIKYDKSLKPETLARQTSRFSGAMIQNLVNQAICNAVSDQRTFTEQKDFDVALDRILMGTRRLSFEAEQELQKRTAIYQAGKALASLIIAGSDPIYKVSILPKGDKVSGSTIREEADKTNNQKNQIQAMIQVFLAGRIAEEMFYNQEISTRSQEDYRRASSITLSYMRQMAMDEEFSLISADKKDLSDRFNYLIEEEGTKLLRKLYAETTTLMKKNKWKINKLATLLIQKETLSKDEVILALKLPTLKSE